MTAKLMTWSVAVLLALGLLALWLAREHGASSAPAEPAPARLSTAEAEDQLAAREERSRTLERPAAGGDAAPPEVSAPPDADVLTVGARLLDEQARPLAGARLAWLVPDENGLAVAKHEASSDRTGAVWLVLPRSELPAGPLHLEVGGAAHTPRTLLVERARWENVAILSLGELTLRAGGTVKGK